VASRVINVVLCHQDAKTVETLLDLWHQTTSTDSILIAHGGARSDFETIKHRNKIFLDDPRLRVRDKQRERQSYHGIWRATSQWLTSSPHNFDFVHVIEFDHVPLVEDLNERQIELLNNEKADVLAYHLQRIDQTSHPHYLYHRRNPRFHGFFREISVHFRFTLRFICRPSRTISVFGFEIMGNKTSSYLISGIASEKLNLRAERAPGRCTLLKVSPLSYHQCRRADENAYSRGCPLFRARLWNAAG